MNPDLARLIELERVDREIARLTEEIVMLPQRVAAIEGRLAEVKSRAAALPADIKAQEALRRRLEGEAQGLRQKISKYREQSLEVKTNEQYKALLHEIEFAEKEIRSVEDKILEAMLQAESGEKELRVAKEELKAKTVVVEKETNAARARTAEDQEQMAQWQARRNALRGSLDSAVLLHYDRVLKLRKSAVAEIRDQKCSACHVVLRPQKYNEVRSNQQVLTCDSCGRILFFNEGGAVEAEVTPPHGMAAAPGLGVKS